MVRTLDIVMKKIIFVVAMILLIFGVCLSFQDKTGGAFVTYGAAIFCLIFAFLQEFKRFKGLGIEAEVLEKKIEEADVILGHLRSLSVPLAELLFTMVARLGRWDSAVPRKDTYRIMKGFEEALRGLKVPEDKLSRAKAESHRYKLDRSSSSDCSEAPKSSPREGKGAKESHSSLSITNLRGRSIATRCKSGTDERDKRIG